MRQATIHRGEIFEIEWTRNEDALQGLGVEAELRRSQRVEAFTSPVPFVSLVELEGASGSSVDAVSLMDFKTLTHTKVLQ